MTYFRITLAAIMAGFIFLTGVAAAAVWAQDGYTLEDISFMVGHWKGEGENEPEEIWLSPSVGVMPGFMRWPMENGLYVIESLTFVEVDGGLTFYFKHFDTKIGPWETEPNTYRVTLVAGNCLTMAQITDNAKVPEYMRYCRAGEDGLRFAGSNDEQTIDDSDFVLNFNRVVSEDR